MEVKWIKLNVGMFDGNSFKRIKKAKIGGESFRDKLTAVWFELMDFAGKCNAGGQLIESSEIPFASIEDIAIMIDRETDELQLCMNYFINNGMVTLIDDVYMLTNWSRYQNEDGLEKIREQNRKRQAKFKQNQKLLASQNTDNVMVTLPLTLGNATEEEIEEEIEEETEEDKDKKKKETSNDLFLKLVLNYSFSDSLKSKASDWIKYKSEKNHPYKEMGMKALLSRIEKHSKIYGDDAVCDLIDECMSCGWQGIIFDKLKSKSQSEQGQVSPKTNASYDLDQFRQQSLHGELKYERKNR